MIHLILSLCLYQDENLNDSIAKYRTLWYKSVDTLHILSNKLVKTDNILEHRKLKKELEECMDRNVHYFDEYFKYRDKLDELKVKKAIIIEKNYSSET